jgi:Protein of unknown function (DUF4054)
MTVTAELFRRDFIEFADGERYPDPVIMFWIGAASQLVNADRWGSLLNTGIELLVAHQITLERKALDEAARGGIPGMTPGIINNKSVDKVSIGYDTQPGMELDAGHWNLTIYGTRYIRLVRMMGIGPLQIGVGSNPVAPFSSAEAWGGPWPWNVPNPS